MTPIASAIANVQLMSPWNACVIVPGTAKMPTQASDVAIVSLSGKPTQAENAGTIRMPPPMPSSPDSIPAATPITPSVHHWSRRWSTVPIVPSARTTGNAVRYAVKPTSTAVAIISQCPLPGTARDSREPATEARTPNAEVQSTIRPQMRCSRL